MSVCVCSCVVCVCVVLCVVASERAEEAQESIAGHRWQMGERVDAKHSNDGHVGEYDASQWSSLRTSQWRIAKVVRKNVSIFERLDCTCECPAVGKRVRVQWLDDDKPNVNGSVFVRST